MLAPSFVRSTFQSTTLNLVADSHGANEVANSSLWRDSWEDIKHCIKSRCFLHRQHKVGSIMLCPLKSDVRGMLHFSLMLGFSGRWPALLDSFTKHMKRTLRVFRFEDRRLSAEAVQYRQQALEHFGSCFDKCTCEANAEVRKQTRSLPFQLLNGDWPRPGWEHWCKGPTCCKSPSETAEKLQECVINRLEYPCHSPALCPA